MKYKLYQFLKYTTIALLLFLLIVYIGKTDRLPRFIPDDIRNALVDFSDSVLSHDTFKSIYVPFAKVVDFLADDGYTYKYEELPKIILERINTELFAIDNNVNLFLNNPLFETWIITSLASQSPIVKGVFTNYFSEDFYCGFSIYNSKLREVFSYAPLELKNPGLLLKNTLVFYDGYLLKVKNLSKDIDFIDGYFVVFIDSKKFFDYVLNSEKDDFNVIFVYEGDKVYYSTKMYDFDYLSSILGKSEVFINGKSFFQKNVPFYNMSISFVYPKPSFIRWIFIVFKLLVFGFIVYFLILLNNSIKQKLSYSEEKKKILVKSLKREIGVLPFKSEEQLHNTFIKTTEQTLKYFDEFVKTDVSSTKETKKKVSLFNRG